MADYRFRNNGMFAPMIQSPGTAQMLGNVSGMLSNLGEPAMDASDPNVWKRQGSIALSQGNPQRAIQMMNQSQAMQTAQASAAKKQILQNRLLQAVDSMDISPQEKELLKTRIAMGETPDLRKVLEDKRKAAQAGMDYEKYISPDLLQAVKRGDITPAEAIKRETARRKSDKEEKGKTRRTQMGNDAMLEAARIRAIQGGTPSAMPTTVSKDQEDAIQPTLKSLEDAILETDTEDAEGMLGKNNKGVIQAYKSSFALAAANLAKQRNISITEASNRLLTHVTSGGKLVGAMNIGQFQEQLRTALATELGGGEAASGAESQEGTFSHPSGATEADVNSLVDAGFTWTDTGWVK